MARSARVAIMLGMLAACVAVLLVTPGMADDLGPRPSGCSYTPECVGIMAGHMLGNTLVDDPGCCQEIIGGQKVCWDYTVKMFALGRPGSIILWGANVWSHCLTIAKPATPPSLPSKFKPSKHSSNGAFLPSFVLKLF